MTEVAQAQGVPAALLAGREYTLYPDIYERHVRHLLRDKHLGGQHRHVLELELNLDYSHIYRRNPHFIVSLMDAVAEQELNRPGF